MKSTIKCDKCGCETTIVNTYGDGEDYVYRHRLCRNCGNSFYSEEYQVCKEDEPRVKEVIAELIRKQRYKI